MDLLEDGPFRGTSAVSGATTAAAAAADAFPLLGRMKFK